MFRSRVIMYFLEKEIPRGSGRLSLLGRKEQELILLFIIPSSENFLSIIA